MIEHNNGVYRVTARSAIADGIMILLLVGGFIVLCIGCFTIFIRGFSWPLPWILMPVGVVCAVAGALLLKYTDFHKLVVEISEEGVIERASKVSSGIIRWKEIASVRIYEGKGTNAPRRGGHKNDMFIGITLVDPDAYARKLNIVQKGIMKLCLRTGHEPINIPCNILGGDAESLVEICNNMMKKKRE